MSKRLATAIGVVAILVTGCASTPATPVPATKAPATAAPATAAPATAAPATAAPATAAPPTAAPATPTAVAATATPEPTVAATPTTSASGDVTMLLVGFPDQDTTDPTTGAPIPGVNHHQEMFTAANPTINLKIINIPFGEGATNYTAKTTSMLQNNEACVYYAPCAFDFGHQGLLEDLGPMVDADQTMQDAFLGDTVHAYEGWTPDNPHALLGIPFKGGTRVIHYDSKLFTDWGVEPLAQQPTLQEIHDKAIAMTGKNPVTGEQNYGYWYQGKYINWQFQTIAHAMGANWGQVNDDGTWTINWDTPEYLAALNWLVDMSKYAPPGALASDAMPDGFLTDSNVVGIIPEGETGYYLTPFLADPSLAQRFRTTFNLVGPDGKGGLFAVDPLTMAKSCDNKDAGWQVIKWMTTSKEAQRYIFQQGNIPVIKDSADIVPELAALPDGNVILQANANAEARYPWAASQPRFSLQSAIEAALAGTISPEDALKQALQETDDWLATQNTQ